MFSIVVSQKVNANSTVWEVSIEGMKAGRQFCKSARSAMKYMFFLKSKLGVSISKEAMNTLSIEIARVKLAEAAAGRERIQEHAEALAEAYDVNNALASDHAEEKPAPKRRGRKPKAEKAA